MWFQEHAPWLPGAAVVCAAISGYFIVHPVPEAIAWCPVVMAWRGAAVTGAAAR